MSRGQLEFIKEQGIEPRQLIDCGVGEVGSEAWLAKELWPGIEVVGFEPNPDRLGLLAAAQYPGWLFPLAVGAENCERTLKVFGEHLNGGFYWEYDVAIDHYVRMTRLDDTMSHRPDLSDALLWLDIEGSEYAAIVGGQEMLKKCIAVVVEVRDEVPCPGWCTASEVAEILKGAGFTKAKEFPSGPTDPQRDEVWLR